MAHRVLIIEDYHDTAETTKLLLSLAGYDVQTAPSGSAGLAAARSFRPRVILCDIAMPGMNGYDVARACGRSRGWDPVCLIAVTGYARSEDQREAREAGFDLHLTKPVDVDELRRVLDSISAG